MPQWSIKQFHCEALVLLNWLLQSVAIGILVGLVCWQYSDNTMIFWWNIVYLLHDVSLAGPNATHRERERWPKSCPVIGYLSGQNGAFLSARDWALCPARKKKSISLLVNNPYVPVKSHVIPLLFCGDHFEFKYAVIWCEDWNREIFENHSKKGFVTDSP